MIQLETDHGLLKKDYSVTVRQRTALAVAVVTQAPASDLVESFSKQNWITPVSQGACISTSLTPMKDEALILGD